MSTPSIAVIHHELDVGGGESVCFHILDELQYRYDLHLYSLNRPDFGRLNEACGTDVTNLTVHVPQTVRFGLNAAKFVGSAISQDDFQVPAGLKIVLLSHQYASEWRTHDLRISTYGEFPLSPPAIQYIHHPFLNRWNSGGYFQVKSVPGSGFNRLYTRLSGANRRVVQQSELLTNSHWTADQIESIYYRPDVVYPPVAVDECPETPWEEREDGFLLIGRVSADKQSHRAITILDGVRKRGHEVHLHVIGRMDTSSKYGKRMAKAIAQREWITAEGYVPQDALLSMIRDHKWAIHTKEHEHFGMAVAEQVAGGALPFVPNAGGQVEIVDDDPTLCYRSISDAIEKIDGLLANPSQCRQKLDQLPDVTERFGEEQFKQEIRERIDKELASGDYR